MTKKMLLKKLQKLADECDNVQIESILYSTILVLTVNEEKSLADNIQIFTKRNILPKVENKDFKLKIVR